MIFIETTTFTKLIGSYLSDDEYRGLQGFMLEHPDSGKIVRGSGGVRKLRWATAGKGKSGGIRVIYYWKRADNEVWLLNRLWQKRTGNHSEPRFEANCGGNQK